jgi:hypothetical protein
MGSLLPISGQAHTVPLLQFEKTQFSYATDCHYDAIARIRIQSQSGRAE